jgi:predicted nucleic acid-binding protein
VTARYVFDTGALIGAERGDRRALDFLALVQKGRAEVLTPVICVVEWWRGRTDARERLLRAVRVEPVTLAVAKAAGVCLASLRERSDSKLSIDATVMAFAALTDSPVVTSDPKDLGTLHAFFPGVRVLALNSRF